MLKIVCVNADNYCGLGKQYVENLYDMCRRNLSEKVNGQFICFTDDDNPYTEGIQKRPLHGCPKGWFNKLYLFKKDLFDEGDRIIYFDLDTCIVGGLDSLITYDGDFAILRDAYRPDGLQSSVMAWKANIYSHIWDDYVQLGFPNTPGGDQTWIEMSLDKKPDILQQIYPHQFRSYKKDCGIHIPQDTKVVFFHGHPRPHECFDNWVEQIWKIGGGTTMEFELVGNVSDETMTAHIEHALSLPHELLHNKYAITNDMHLCIVGGAPSLADDIEEIRYRQNQGQIIWALNNTFKYLTDRDIHPDCHIMLDARLENIEFVPEKTNATLLYALQCHPDVIDKASKATDRFIMWAPMLPGMIDCLDRYKKNVVVVGGGSSVGMKALALTQAFGFRNIHLFGFDSCYKNGENHAYKQPLNDGERIIEVICNGHDFTCAAWMAKQVQEFREFAPHLINNGATIAVHGSGLLPYMASLMEVRDNG